MHVNIPEWSSSLVKDNKGCYLLFATTNNASVDIYIHFIFWISVRVILVIHPGVGSWELQDICTLYFTDYFQMALQNSCTNSHSRQQCLEVST